MAVKYGKLEMPQKIIVDEKTSTATFARFIAEPFERGFGHTVGSSMRRMMLSSLEAPAILSIRLQGVPHEYTAIEGIVEDMTTIILNFKGALLRKLPMDDTPGSRDFRVVSKVIDISQEDLDEKKGQVIITLEDVIDTGEFDVVNPELPLFTVTAPLKKQLDVKIGIGRGYVPSERHAIRNKAVDEILIDAAFSPVRLVNYYVENTRVGQDTDYDRLILEVTTDGRISPVEAVTFASQIGTLSLEVFNKIKAHSLVFEEGSGEGDTDYDEMMDKLALRIDEIELSVRSTNCLSNANIETIAELVSISPKKMLEFRNFGKKSLNEITEKLTEMGLSLGMDLSRFGITEDNVKDQMAQYYKRKKGHKEATQPVEE